MHDLERKIEIYSKNQKVSSKLSEIKYFTIVEGKNRIKDSSKP